MFRLSVLVACPRYLFVMREPSWGGFGVGRIGICQSVQPAACLKYTVLPQVEQ
jgi:hypothetical protein